MKAHFTLFHSWDLNLIIKLISLGTFEALIITSQGLKKKKGRKITFTTYSHTAFQRVTIWEPVWLLYKIDWY